MTDPLSSDEALAEPYFSHEAYLSDVPLPGVPHPPECPVGLHLRLHLAEEAYRGRRELVPLLDVVGDLERRGVGFKSLRESVDTTTPGGRLVFHLFGALAEFERDLIRERTAAGLAAARARGRKGGRPPVMTPAKAAVAGQLYDARRHPVATIAKTLGVSRASIYRALAAPPAGDAAPPARPRGPGESRRRRRGAAERTALPE